jgi:ribosomal protein S18 acetylase RimI-like enzyme
LYVVVELKYSQSSYNKILSNLRESLIKYFVETIHEDITEADFWYEKIENIIKSESDDYTCFEARSRDDIIGFVIIRQFSKEFALIRHIFVLDTVNRKEVAYFLLKKAFEKIKNSHEIIKFNNAAFTFPEDYLADPLKKLGYNILKRQNLTLNLDTFDRTNELLSKYSFVPLNENFFSKIAELSVNAFKNHPDTAFWEEVNSVPLYLEYLKNSLTTYMLMDCSYVVKDEKEQIIGLCLIEKGDKEGEIIIQNLAVNRLLRGKGIGTALISKILNVTHKKGYKKAILTVTEGIPAQRIYERLGFKKYNSFNVIINV